MPNAEFTEDWINNFVEFQLKDLRGEELTPEERCFLAALELADQAMPGVIAEELLRQSLGEVMANSYPARIAAASAPAESELYREVQKLIQNGKTELLLELDSGPLPVLQIHAAENMVEPRLQEGYIFIVERNSLERQVVGKYGGIFITLDDLKKMELDYDPATRTIRLYGK